MLLTINMFVCSFKDTVTLFPFYFFTATLYSSDYLLQVMFTISDLDMISPFFYFNISHFDFGNTSIEITSLNITTGKNNMLTFYSAKV